MAGLMDEGDCLVAEVGSDGEVPDVDGPGGVPGIGGDPADEDDDGAGDRLPAVGD